MTNLTVDIETLPDQSEGALESAAELVKVPANYKKEEVIEKYRQEHAEEEFLKTGLHGISGEICSIAWAIDDKEVDALTVNLNVENEEELLIEFFHMVDEQCNSGEGKFPNITWIGHNI